MNEAPRDFKVLWSLFLCLEFRHFDEEGLIMGLYQHKR